MFINILEPTNQLVDACNQLVLLTTSCLYNVNCQSYQSTIFKYLFHSVANEAPAFNLRDQFILYKYINNITKYSISTYRYYWQ